jgi:DHA1 family multidrug resistance protein-like MFS transporter
VTDAGRQEFWAGLALAAGGITFAVFAPIWGILADRYGRKSMVCRAMFGGALAILLISFSRTVPQLLMGRVFQGIFSGTLAASIALVASVVPMRHSGFALGMMQAAVFIGNAAGPLIGGITSDAFGYRVSFRIGALLAFSGGLLTLLGTMEKFTPPKSDHVGAGIPGFRALFLLPGFMLGVLVLFSVRFSNSISNPSFPLIVTELLGSPENLNSITGSIIGTAAIAAAVAAAVLGHAGDRFGRKRVLFGCCLVACAASVGHYFVNSIALLFVLRILFGFSVAGMLPAANSMIHEVIDSRAIGKAYGLATSLSMLGGAAGPAIGGGLAMQAGLRVPFLVTGAAQLLLIVLLSRYFSRVKAPGPARNRRERIDDDQ